MTDISSTIVESLVSRLADGRTDVDLYDLRERIAALSADERETLVNEVVSSAYAEAIDSTFAEIGVNREAWMLRAKAISQQTETLAILRQADHVEVIAEARALQATAEKNLAAAEQRAEMLSGEVDRLTVLETEALDRLTDASENHTEIEGEHRQYEALAAKASRLTDSLARLTAARSILDDRQREASAATSARASVDAVLNEQRTKLAELRTSLEAAKGIVEAIETNPDAAPRSEMTLRYGLLDAITGYGDLAPGEKAALRSLVASFSRAIGADREAVIRGRDQTLKEAQAKVDRQRALTPAKGSVTVFPPGIG